MACGLRSAIAPCPASDSLPVGEGLKPSPTFWHLHACSNRTTASLPAWAPDLGRRVRPRPGNRENRLMDCSLWLVACSYGSLLVVRGFKTTRRLRLAVCNKANLPPRRGGPGWGFGKWLVACSSWPVETRFCAVSYIPTPTSYNLFTTYHALRTTYHEPSSPHPTNRLPQWGRQNRQAVCGSWSIGIPWRVGSLLRPIQNPPRTTYTYHALRTTHRPLT